MSELLKFPFKGNRNYIHGTSLFNALIKAALQRGLKEGKISVSFKRMIHNPICVLEARLPTANDAVVAQLSGQYGEELALCINEGEYTVEAGREEFDEPEACRGAVVTDNCIKQSTPHHQDLIELLVALCKKMHQESVDASKKWVFSRYEGQFPIPKPDSVELKIIKQIGTRLTCSDVLINNQKIGNIYFS